MTITDVGPEPQSFDLESATLANTNIGGEPMRLYAVYAPVHHGPGRVHATAADAARDEESGDDQPPSWSVQPSRQPADEHA